ncbi:MAG: DUF4080 domain-containing protein [Gammaproteobacteria bacterium]|nr:DUF4080 domain-containing protein [Gammaproteobacteria bacterium]
MTNSILLTTLNAKYIHSSLGLRYLYAQMEELQEQTTISEFNISDRVADIAEQIILQKPRIVGFGVYIWNIDQITEVVSLLKAVLPETTIIVGGPEVSYEYEQTQIYTLADHIITGQADNSFKQTCLSILHGFPVEKVIHSNVPSPESLTLPYNLYNEEDITQRVLYVEASRGCPFKCEFCLSSLDKTAKAFDIDKFLLAMDDLYQRGARSFKFVDRTFNLNIQLSQQILNFFLSKNDDSLFLHFELIPDRLPEQLKELILKFPAGNVQFEIGIQTFTPEVQQLISRKQDHQKTVDNLTWLCTQTDVHLHTDLIAGLPGETMQSYAKSFDLLIELGVQEIQMGILKRLKGTPIIRHTNKYQLIFSPQAPYNILQNRDLSFIDLQDLNRFARYWNLVGNSGRFKHTLKHLLKDNPFNEFMAFTRWLFNSTQQTHKIALPRLFKLVYQYLKDEPELINAMQQDFTKTGIKKTLQQVIGDPINSKTTNPNASQRQQRHQK